MTKSFLFGGASTSQSQNKHLVEFRAGKMTMKDKKVSADKRKGLVYVHQTDDSLMHFCWKDRTTGAVEDDLIIFPEDVVFKRVPECTTGRVYVLKFKSSSRRCFYWLQESKTDRDNEYCSKVNQYLNNPPAAGSSRAERTLSLAGTFQSTQGLQSELCSLGDSDLQNLLNNMSQQQLIQLLGGVGGVSGMPSLSSLLGSSRSSTATSASSTESTRSTETPQPTRARENTTSRTTQSTPVISTPTPVLASAAASSIQLSDLQNILSGLSVPAQGESSSKTPVDLSSSITAEALQPLINNKELMDRIKTFLPPPSDASTAVNTNQLHLTVQCSQFQQALRMISAALQSGQLGPLMQQFGMNSEVVAAATSGDMDTFVKALQKSKRNASESSKESKDQDKEEDMNLD